MISNSKIKQKKIKRTKRRLKTRNLKVKKGNERRCHRKPPSTEKQTRIMDSTSIEAVLGKLAHDGHCEKVSNQIGELAP